MSAVTLDNCEREPIHIPGAIQSHGALIACRGDQLIIQQASQNTLAYLGTSVDDLLETSAFALFDEATGERLRQRTAVPPGPRPSMRESTAMSFATRGGIGGTAVFHRSGDVQIIEIEGGQGADAGTFDPRLRASLVPLQRAHGVEALCHSAVREVRSLSGFDRVMVYRFDTDWNGQVVAEARREDLEPFLGLHYPASDIPPQARRLYAENWVRLIADVNYVPVPLSPVLDPVSGAPLDLSHAALRSVSPIHIEYLRNMGVTASMSISLVIDGELRGLIACHHYSGPHVLRFQLRDTVEYLGQALSWHLRALESVADAESARRAHEHESVVVRTLALEDDLVDGLASPPMLSLAGAAGMVALVEGATRSIGRVPSAEQITALVKWLGSEPREVFATDRLAAHFPEASGWDDVAAGLVAVALSAELGEWLLWFRPSTERTVDWAGDPRKNVVPGDGVAPDRLSPRGSFALWRETVKGRSQPWERWQIEAASNVRRVVLAGVRKRASTLRAMNETLMEADRAKDTFIAMVSHELRTPLNAINGWSHLLSSERIPKEKWKHAVEVIARNSDTLAHLVDDLLDISRIVGGKLSLQVRELEIGTIVQNVVEAVALSAQAKNIRIKTTIDSSGSAILGDPDRLSQVATNLLTNAIKFTPKGGSVKVVVLRHESDVELSVIDSGQGIPADFLPHVFDWFRQADGALNRRAGGLGLGLAISRRLVELHGGTITATSEGEGKGASFRVRLPVIAVRRESAPVGRAPVASSTDTTLTGIRALVIDDERDSRDLLGQILMLAGAEITPASDAASALAFLRTQRFDVIVSDIGMPEMDGLQLMSRLRSGSIEEGAQTPAVALTAYSRGTDRMAALRAGFQAHMAKPADAEELVAVVSSLVGRLQPPGRSSP